MVFVGKTVVIKLDTAALSYFDLPAFIVDVYPEKGPVYAVVNQKWSDGARRLPRDVVGKTAVEIFGRHLGLAPYTRQMEVICSGQKLTLLMMTWVQFQCHVKICSKKTRPNWVLNGEDQS